VSGQIEELGYEIPKKNILVEPEGKNTLPAICFGMREIEKRFGRSVVGIFSSDHLLDINAMDAIAKSKKLADDHLVTFGIVPTGPHTGYGYIKPGLPIESGYIVSEFKEKPDIETAKQYIKKGYMWNSGMFLFNTQLFFAELQLHAPQLWNEFCVPGKYIEDIYNTVPNISVDYGILEKSNKIAVVKLVYKWSDLGNFDALYQEFEKDEKGNIVHNCDDLSVDSTGNLIYSTRKKVVSLIDINDTIVIDTRDALMVCPRRSSQKVKEVVTILKNQGDERITLHRTVYRPWGSHTTLESSPRHSIKRLSIMPHKSIGTHTHDHRTEHWVVIKGTASVTIGDNESVLEQGESTFIRRSVKHKIFNPGSGELEIIEVQLGEYVGDDDTTRYES